MDRVHKGGPWTGSVWWPMDWAHGLQVGPWTRCTGVVHGHGSMFCVPPVCLGDLKYARAVLNVFNSCTVNNYSPKWRWQVVDIYRAMKWRGKYPPLATDTEVNSCFSIY